MGHFRAKPYDREKYWIIFYTKLGCDLLNIVHVDPFDPLTGTRRIERTR